MGIDLQSMSLKELKDLNVALTRAIVGFEERKRVAAISALEAVARESGFSLYELVGGGVVPPKKTRAPAVAEYANPQNKDNTWSGRGRKPSWFEAALAKGKTPESMAIKSN